MGTENVHGEMKNTGVLGLKGPTWMLGIGGV
jgi:hypothetical protein